MATKTFLKKVSHNTLISFISACKSKATFHQVIYFLKDISMLQFLELSIYFDYTVKNETCVDYCRS
jgi:hypothetical protein